MLCTIKFEILEINMPKKVLIVFSFFYFVCTIGADELADLLQDLAIQTACLGMYSTAQTGVYVTSRYDDPPNWYDPPMMANRFAQRSGNMTRTITFYGICFDYAQWAWDDIKKYQKIYNDAGMKGQQWYIAVAESGKPNAIILYEPVAGNEATTTWNGVSVKENSRYNVLAHDIAQGHAWLWVQHNNGTWYWIDPTWTDNTGYPWWGIVKNNKEVQYYPNPNFCTASNYPRPPSPDETKTERETRSPNSTYVSYSGNPTYYTGNYDPSKSNYLLVGYNYANGLPIGLTIADSMFLKRSLIYISANIGGFPDNFGVEWIYGVSIATTDWLRIPIGIGGSHISKKVKTPTGGYSMTNGVYEYEYEDALEWEHKFVIEIGLQPVLFDFLYLSATYRLIGFKESGFSIGAGFVF
jgi:hypothetical protein